MAAPDDVVSNTRIDAFSLGASASPLLSCEICGLPRRGSRACRNCCLHLVDLALTISLESHPRLFEGTSDDHDTNLPGVECVYAHYELCRSPEGFPWELGRGSMGITYKAVDTHLKCPVALKIINARCLNGAEARDRFMQEARTAASLRHTNIASVFHLGLDAEDCFYAMEYIEGETLEARVRRVGRLRPEVALDIVTQSARALRIAHEKRVIHRDIKPTNIMLVDTADHPDGDELVKLIDFGLAKAFADDPEKDFNSRSYFVGTPVYASPEQLGFKAIDARSDIYSLGRCLWFMLTGTPPTTSSHDGGDGIGGLDPGTSFDGIPSPLLDLLKSLVATNPILRPQTADGLLRQLKECVTLCGFGTEADGPAQRGATVLNRKVTSRQTLTMALGLVAVAAAMLMVAALKLTSRSGSAAALVQGSPRSLVSVEARVAYEQGTESFRRNSRPDLDRAIALYSKAIALSPSFADAHAALAAAYHMNVARWGAPASQLELAIASAQRAIAIDPKAPTGYQALGAIRNLQGQPWEALTQLRLALEADPKCYPAMCDFSLLWTSVGQPQLGLPWAEAATRLVPLKAQAWQAAAEASVDLCADDQAERFYKKCLEPNPIWMSAHFGLIHINLLRGDFVRARQGCATAESIHAGSILNLTLKAQIALFSGQYSEAEAAYRQLLTLNRGGYVSYYSGISYLSALGFLRTKANDKTEGETFLKEAAELHVATSEGPQGIYDLAAIRAIEGQNEDALILLRQSITSGWMDYRATRLDPRFESLRPEARFHEMLLNLENHVARRRQESLILSSKPLNLADYPVQPPAR